MTEVTDVVADLRLEGETFDGMLTGLDPSGWDEPTPAPGWTVKHQVAHMTATFRLAALSASAPERFTAINDRLSPDFNANVEYALSEFLPLGPAELFARWQAEKAQAENALDAIERDRIVPWLVRPLPAAVLAAAGIMELFAHGQDIADGIGVRREYSDRIRHLVDFGIRTWDFGYQVRGLTAPDVEFGYQLTAPSGRSWQLGNPDADQVISGPAVDFCMLITRRRHRDDLDLTAKGADADQWLNVAQAYRGPAGPGRQPGQFATPATH